MKLSYPREVELFQWLARSLGAPFVDLREYRISSGILRKLPRDLAMEYRCVPMVFNRRRVVLVHDSPADALRLAADPPPFLRFRAREEGSRSVEFALTTSSALDEALARRLSLADEHGRGSGGR